MGAEAPIDVTIGEQHDRLAAQALLHRNLCSWLNTHGSAIAGSIQFRALRQWREEGVRSTLFEAEVIVVDVAIRARILASKDIDERSQVLV